ncbi:hypothetical protein KAV79_07335 [Candidatus Aerophobetes bacterium]|nr:hypothetical protein [Candidatus Aerophobetes bacterium]
MALSYHFLRAGVIMNSIMRDYELANFYDFSITKFPFPISYYAQKIKLIDLFEEHLKIKMKKVHHSPVEKIIELFVSMISGCPDVKSIDNHLVPDKLVVVAWDQKQFTDQSQASLVLHRITAKNLLELEEMFQKLLCQKSLARQHPPNEWLVVDVNMSTLPVDPGTGTHERVSLEFMQKEKGKACKLTCPYTKGEFGEVLERLFGSGTTCLTTQLNDLPLLIEKRVGSPPSSLAKSRNRIGPLPTQAKMLEGRARKRKEAAQIIETSQSFDPLRYHNPRRLILIRADAALSTLENSILLIELGYDFFLKRYSPQTTRLLLRQVLENQWMRFNPLTSVIEPDIIKLSGYTYPARFALGRSKSAKSEPLQYFHLLTTVPERLEDFFGVLKFYHTRKIIKSFIKTEKNVFNLKDFGVRNFYKIQFTLTLRLLAYNFMNWAKGEICVSILLVWIRIREFIEQALRIPGQIKLLKIKIPVTLFPGTSVYAQA